MAIMLKVGDGHEAIEQNAEGAVLSGLEALKQLGGWSQNHSCWTRTMPLRIGESVTVLEVREM